MIKTSHYNPTHKNYFHRASKFAILSHCHAYSSFEIAVCPHPLSTKEKISDLLSFINGRLNNGTYQKYIQIIRISKVKHL